MMAVKLMGIFSSNPSSFGVIVLRRDYAIDVAHSWMDKGNRIMIDFLVGVRGEPMRVM
jgi:hypothetical protein